MQVTFIPSVNVLNPETGKPVLCAGLRYPLAEVQRLSTEWGFDCVPGKLYLHWD